MNTQDLADLAPVLTGAATAAVSVAGLARSHGKSRARLKADADIVAALPPDSQARKKLLDDIDRRVDALIDSETTRTRDLPMLGMALVVTPVLAFLTVWLFQVGAWWGYGLALPAALVTAIFVFGIFETASPAKRDSRGIRVGD